MLDLPKTLAESSASLYLSKVQLSSVVHFSSFNQSLRTTPKVAAKGSSLILQRWLHRANCVEEMHSYSQQLISHTGSSLMCFRSSVTILQ